MSTDCIVILLCLYTLNDDIALSELYQYNCYRFCVLTILRTIDFKGYIKIYTDLYYYIK